MSGGEIVEHDRLVAGRCERLGSLASYVPGTAGHEHPHLVRSPLAAPPSSAGHQPDHPPHDPLTKYGTQEADPLAQGTGTPRGTIRDGLRYGQASAASRFGDGSFQAA